MQQNLYQDQIFNTGFRILHDAIHSVTDRIISEDDLKVIVMTLNRHGFMIKHHDEIEKYLSRREVTYQDKIEQKKGLFLGFANEFKIISQDNAVNVTQVMIETLEGNIVLRNPTTVKFLDV